MPALRRSAVLAAFAFLACSPARRAPWKVHDLLALFPLADVRQEVGMIDFGTPAGREHLASGWYPNERSADGATYVWSRGEASVVEFFLAAPRDLKAEIRCAPFDGDGLPQRLSLAVNGRPLSALDLAPGMHDYAFALPRAALAAGTNRLELRYRNVSEPSRASGHRRLAVRFDALRFRPGGPAAEPPRIEMATAEAGNAGSLYLPYGSGVVYYLDVPAGGELALGGLDERGEAGGGRLAVAARTEEGEDAERELAPGRGERTVALPGRGERLVRLALRSIHEPAGGQPGGLGGLLLAAPAIVAPDRPAVPARGGAAAARRPSHPLWPARPNVVVYLVDTLRADRLGCYGGAKPLSPNVDAFARGATLFERTIAQSTWTRPAVTSLLTGLGPLAHGVETLDDRLPQAATTLPEILHAAGYRTAAFSTNPQVSAGTGLAQGFDDFELFFENPGSAAVNRRVLAWLDRPRGGSPFFLYVHTIDPHAPYKPVPEMRRRFAPGIPEGAGSHAEVVKAYAARGPEREARVARLRTLYDAEVAGNDESFGALLAELKRRGLYDGALVVFVADHGEEFDEHGELGHGNDLYQQTLRVPLVVKWPGQARGERVAALAQQVDLLPTVLAAAGLPRPPGLAGADLFALRAALSGDAAQHRAALSHLDYDGRQGVSLVDGSWKLILPLTPKLGAGPELYRLDADPGERVDLAARDDVRAGWLRARLEGELRSAGAARAAVAGGRQAPVDEETRRSLRALGYL